jgi:hypothetical protein
MDYHAKKAIWETIPDPEAPAKWFPLELICVYLGKKSSPWTKEKGSNSGCSSNKHDHSITTRTSFMTRNSTP